MVECQLPKLDVAGSNPVSRSINLLEQSTRKDLLASPNQFVSNTFESFEIRPQP